MIKLNYLMNIYENIWKYTPICMTWTFTVGCLSAILCVLPSLLSHDNTVQELSPGYISMKSSVFKESLMACIVVSLPMLLDIILDSQTHKYTDFISRCGLLFSLLAANIVMYFYVVPYGTLDLLGCVLNARLSLCYGSVLSLLGHYDPAFWTTPKLKIVGITMCTSLIVISYEVSYPNPTIAAFSIVAYILGFVVYAYFALQYVFLLSSQSSMLTSKQLCGLFATAPIPIFFTSTILLFIFLGEFVTWPAWAMATCVYIQGFITIIATVLPGRISRRETILAEEALYKKSLFVRYISHEVRTPLNTVFMGLRLLRDVLSKYSQYPTNDWIRKEGIVHDTNDILESCNTALTILNEILVIDKIEDGRLTLNQELVMFYPFVDAVVKPFGIQAREAGISLQYDDKFYTALGAYPPHFLYVDRPKMSQVLRNLLANALKFCSAGGHVRISARLEEVVENSDILGGSGYIMESSHEQNIFRHNGVTYQKRVVVVDIQDDGCGISQENQVKLFKECVQFHANELQGGGGSGLGLFISNSFAELHGGCLQVHSEGEHKGSTFSLRLPIYYPDESTSTSFEKCSMKMDRLPMDVETVGTSELPNPYTKPPSPALDVPPSNADTLLNDSCCSTSEDRDNKATELSSNIPRTRRESKSTEEVKQKHVPRVLVVDDSALNRKLLGRILSRNFDANFDLACDGIEAVNKVKTSMGEFDIDQSQPEPCSGFDAVFMDFVMPNMDGPTATKEIRKLGFRGKIIGITGNVLPDDVVHFKEHGADDVFAKPIEVGKLAELFKQLGH